MPQSIDDLIKALEGVGYYADRRLATAVFLALKLERPLLLEGEPGRSAGFLQPRNWLDSHRSFLGISGSWACSGFACVLFSRRPHSRGVNRLGG